LFLFYDPKLHVLGILNLIMIHLKYGRTQYLAFVLTYYAQILCQLNDVKERLSLWSIALRLAEGFGDQLVMEQLHFLVPLFCQPSRGTASQHLSVDMEDGASP